MDDKDRPGEARGAEDALRPERPGGERKTGGEIDQRPDPATAIPRQTNPGGADASEASRGTDDRAAGTIDNPISAGDGEGSNDYQAGDLSELSAQRGGPIDISRDRPKRR
ncbi:hypothetical protein [Falsiroseomonas sp. HW251]|uniref:hypothetical protein n=1 Tax=Falsiroseomonas sp. HW251 TaxID=3390998 RepID=UPI003D31326C